jgi:tetratricopeptide (TPR) repeat protein
VPQSTEDCESAVGHFKEGRQIINNNPSALSEYGSCLVQTHQTPIAVTVFERLCELRPEDSLARYDLAAVQHQAHLNEQAIQTLQPLVKGPKPSVDALNLIAAAYEANQQTPLAVAALQQAIALAPSDIDNYLDLATLSLDHGAFKVGVDMVNAGLHAVPDSAPLYLERRVLEVQMGHYDEADADFRKAAALNPLQNESSVALGISLLQENKLDESVQVVKQRLAKAPDDPTLNYLLAELLIRAGVQPGTPSFQEAEAAAQRAVRSKPDFALAEDVLTELYLRSGETGLAEATSRLALKSDPNDQSALDHLIVCLHRIGDRRELPQLVQRLAEVTAGLRE